MGTNTTKLGLLKPSENDFYNQQTEQAENWEKVDKFADDIQKNVDFNLLATLGISYGGILNNTNPKLAGVAYYDEIARKLFKCIQNTSVNYADAEFFEAISNNDLLKVKVLHFVYNINSSTPAFTVHRVTLHIPAGYRIAGLTATGRVQTNNIEQGGFNSIDTPISYSYDSNNVFKFAVLVNTASYGRAVDVIVNLVKL